MPERMGWTSQRLSNRSNSSSCSVRAAHLTQELGSRARPARQFGRPLQMSAVLLALLADRYKLTNAANPGVES